MYANALNFQKALLFDHNLVLSDIVEMKKSMTKEKFDAWLDASGMNQGVASALQTGIHNLTIQFDTFE